jgi:hypothetical protein
VERYTFIPEYLNSPIIQEEEQTAIDELARNWRLAMNYLGIDVSFIISLCEEAKVDFHYCMKPMVSQVLTIMMNTAPTVDNVDMEDRKPPLNGHVVHRDGPGPTDVIREIVHVLFDLADLLEWLSGQ